MWQIDSSKFIHCKELVDQQILGFQIPNAVYIFNPANQNIQTHQAEGLPCYYSMEKKEKQFKMPTSLLRGNAYEDNLQIDEFYDGFKYLYNEDGTSEAGYNSETGNDDVQGQEESIGACPPLQPAPHIN